MITVGEVDDARNGFDPSQAADRLGHRHGVAAAGRADAAHLRGRRPRTRRSRSRRASFFRPGPTMAACRGRRCARPRASGCGSSSRTTARTRTPCISTASIGAHGRRARRRPDRAGRGVRLRVRRQAVRLPPLPLPRAAAEAAHPQGHVRRLHHRSRSGPASGARGGRPLAPARHARECRLAGIRHGDERLRHQFRRRERGLCRQHRRPRLIEAADPGREGQAGAHLSGQRRSSSTRSTRSTCTPISSTTTTRARR